MLPKYALIRSDKIEIEVPDGVTATHIHHPERFVHELIFEGPADAVRQAVAKAMEFAPPSRALAKDPPLGEVAQG